MGIRLEDSPRYGSISASARGTAGTYRQISTLPRPNDPRIGLLRIPLRLAASLSFSRSNTDDKQRAACESLLTTLCQQAQFPKKGEVHWCVYDTVSFLTRNEAQVELTATQ